MNHQDRQAIEQLFGRLAQVEGQTGIPDAQAAEFIRLQVGRQPNAPYYMAQTIIVQEQALNAAQGRIRQLEQEVASRPHGGAGFLSSLFGGGSTRPQPLQSYAQPPSYGAPPQAMAGMGQVAPGRGGFLAGAAQTAMGVAGGVLLGNMIADAFSGGENKSGQASQPEPQQAAAEESAPAGDDFGFEDDI